MSAWSTTCTMGTTTSIASRPLLKKIMPYLRTLCLNGMDKEGDRHGRKILPLGQGSLDLELLRVICASGYTGPIGILGHTDDDAEERLRDNLDGLDWLVPQLTGKPPGPKPKPRTPVPPPLATAPKPAAGLSSRPVLPDTPKPALALTKTYDPALVASLLEDAAKAGDVAHGAELFASPRLACLSCHQAAGQGGNVGPDLSSAGLCLKPRRVGRVVALAQAAGQGRFHRRYNRDGRRQDPAGLQAARPGRPPRVSRPHFRKSLRDRSIRHRRDSHRRHPHARRAGRIDVGHRPPRPGSLPARPGPAHRKLSRHVDAALAGSRRVHVRSRSARQRAMALLEAARQP